MERGFVTVDELMRTSDPDLLAIGAKFTDPIYDLSPELTAQALKSIARYQAESWETPFGPLVYSLDMSSAGEWWIIQA